jgi:RNA polymerase sigma-70 factor (ECF subfamily)
MSVTDPKRLPQSPIVDQAAPLSALHGTRSQPGGASRSPARALPVEAAAAHAAPVDFRAVYEAEFDYVWRSLRRLGVADRDLEDLAHDVFIAFYRGLDGFDPARPVKPWLFGIAFRVASDHRRRARHRFEVEGSGAEATDAAPPVDEQVARGEARLLVLAALEKVELSRRAVFVMHDLDGCAMPEIARALDVPLNTCYSRLRLARGEFTEAVRRLRGRDGNDLR